MIPARTSFAGCIVRTPIPLVRLASVSGGCRTDMFKRDWKPQESPQSHLPDSSEEYLLVVGKDISGAKSSLFFWTSLTQSMLGSTTEAAGVCLRSSYHSETRQQTPPRTLL
eukprot:6468651-Amphidinium_carterae.1